MCRLLLRNYGRNYTLHCEELPELLQDKKLQLGRSYTLPKDKASYFISIKVRMTTRRSHRRSKSVPPPAMRSFSLAREGQAIADRHHTEIDTRIVTDEFVEPAYRHGRLALVIHFGDTAAPQHIVDGDETARPQ